jgi:hypothetical protein
MGAGEQLLARLGLDTSGFKAGLKDAHSSFEKFARTAGVGISVAGLAAGTRSIIEYGARVSDLAKRYEVSTDAIQKFGDAAVENGSSLEGVAKGFNKLEIAISRGLGGNQRIIKSFAALGVTLDDLRSLSPEEIMKKLGSSSLNAADMVTVLGKSALELRPLLQGVADGSIELGGAIEAGMIKQLKEANKTIEKFGAGLRIFAGQGLAAFGLQFKGVGIDAAAAFKVIREGLSGKNFFSISAQLDAFKKLRDIAGGGGPSKQMWEAYETDRARAMVSDLRSPMELRNPKTDAAIPKSKAELDAEKKDRERNELSLKELAENGPGWGKAATHQGWRHWEGSTMAQGTDQSRYFAAQARLVEQLEAQAKTGRLTGIWQGGQSPDQLMSRADAIRQILPIKESEKEVGIYRQAFKDALSDTNEKLDNIEAALD